MNPIFQNVLEHLEGGKVQEYQVYFNFLGTYGKKRKLERQSLAVGILESEKVTTISKDEFENMMKPYITEKMKENNVKLATEKVQLSFTGQTREKTSFGISTKTDSHLMLNAPKMVYSIKEEKFI